MKKKLLLATVVATASAGAFADRLPASGLNAPDHVDIYAGTYKDRNHERSWVHFTSTNPGQLDRRNIFFNDDEYQLNAFRCGAYTPDGYVGYMSRVYTYVEYPLCFYRLDVETGQYEWLLDMTNDNVYGPNWPVIYDVDYDWSRGTLYALGYQEGNEGYTSALYTINTKTGKYTKTVQNIGFYAACMAIDYDGNFYFLRYETQDGENISGSKIEKMTLENGTFVEQYTYPLAVRGEAFPIYYLNDLTVDHTTGDLYWAADDHENWQRLVRIDPETTETTYLGRIGSYESVVGMYIPFQTASDRLAPARATDFRVAYADRGNAVTLGWANPSTCWNREPLTNLSSIYIARDSESNIIATVEADGQEGLRQQFTDDKASKGLHTYYVTPANAKGNGVPNTYLVWAGEDTPGCVSGLAVSKQDDNTLTVTWAQPTDGAHDGWFDASSLTYNVTRQPDGKRVATGLTATTFTDTQLDDYDNYYYEVQAVNAEGCGPVASTSAVHAGSAIAAPYEALFNTQHEASAWTVIDANYDGKTWEWIGENGLEDMQRMNLNSESADNDLLVSPKLKVEEGKTYRVAADVFMDLPNTYRIRLQEGREAVADAFHTFEDYNFTIGENDPTFILHTLEGTFVADHTGGHHVAVRSLSPGALSNVGVYRVSFEEVQDYDLALTAVDVVPDGVEGKAMSATLTLVNRGLNTMKKTDYRLEAFDVATGAILGSLDGPYSVLVDDQEDVELTFTPATAGKEQIAFRIVSDKDTNARNNTSQTYTFTVAQAGASGWNVDIVEGNLRGDYVEGDTRVPFDFTSNYSNFQSIYDYELIGVEGEITRMGYRYSPLDHFSGSTEVSIDLGTSSRVYYNSPADAIPASRLTNVYCSLMTLDPSEGEHIVSFDFDRPFYLRKGEHLVVNVSREGTMGSMWPVLMNSFNHGTGVLGSIRAASDRSMPSLSQGQCIPFIPCILLSIVTPDGVKEVELQPSAPSTGVYDLLGRPAAGNAKMVIGDGRKTLK